MPDQSTTGISKQWPLHLIFGFLLAGFIFLGLWPYLHFPLTDNEGIFFCIGRELANGAKLYQDVWDHKPPLLFAHFWFLQFFGGDIETRLHLYAIFFHCLNAFLLYRLGKKWLGKLALCCPVTYLVLILPPFLQCWTPQAELLMQPFLLSALLLAAGKKTWRWILAGGLFACGFFTKQSFILFLPLFFFDAGNIGLWEAFCFFAGMDMVALLVVMPFILEGRLDQLWDAVWGFNRLYLTFGWERFSRHPEFRQGLVLWVGKIIWIYGFFLLSAIYYSTDWFYKRFFKKRLAGPFLPILWFFVSLAMVSTSGYFYPYYSIVLIPPLAIITPLTLRKWYLRFPLLVSLGVVFAVTASVWSWGTVWKEGVSALTWSNYLVDRNESAKEMGNFIKFQAKPGDRLLAWTMEPQVYVYSGLRMSPDLKTPLVDHLLVMPEELLKFKERFMKDPPNYVVLSRYDQVNNPPDWFLVELNLRWKLLKTIGKLELFIPNSG
jgi:hypothetical protein